VLICIFLLLGEEHWIGLNNLNHMTQRKKYTLRVRLMFEEDKGIGYFDLFRVGDEVM
jgi:hypothetical protein